MSTTRRPHSAWFQHTVLVVTIAAVPVGLLAIFFGVPVLAMLQRGFFIDGHLDLAIFDAVARASASVSSSATPSSTANPRSMRPAFRRGRRAELTRWTTALIAHRTGGPLARFGFHRHSNGHKSADGAG